MLGYPPKSTSILPDEKDFKPEEWVAQLGRGGWRVVIHGNRVYTRKGKLLPIKTGYPRIKFDYQLDGEIVNPRRQAYHTIPMAIKSKTYRIEIFDIYLPFAKDMKLADRMIFLRKELGIFVPCLELFSYENIFERLHRFQRYGQGGLILKRLDSIYKLSRHCSVTDHNWVNVT